MRFILLGKIFDVDNKIKFLNLDNIFIIFVIEIHQFMGLG